VTLDVVDDFGSLTNIHLVFFVHEVERFPVVECNVLHGESCIAKHPLENQELLGLAQLVDQNVERRAVHVVLHLKELGLVCEQPLQNVDQHEFVCALHARGVAARADLVHEGVPHVVYHERTHALVFDE